MGKKNISKVTIKVPELMEYTVRINSTKDKVKFISRIERIIRSSMEYKDYIAYLRDNVDMHRCAFFNNVVKGDGSKVKVEVHHDPLTLYDIVWTVCNRYDEEGIILDDLLIADEVMELHYLNMVGLIPLSKTLHELVHNSRDIIIPLYRIYGDYSKFVDKYKEYVDESILDKLERRVSETKLLSNDSFDILKPKYTYLEVDGFILPKKVELVENKAV